MRFVLIVALVVVLIGAGMKLAGQKVPFLDYRPGIFGGDVGVPAVEIQAPGYDIDMP